MAIPIMCMQLKQREINVFIGIAALVLIFFAGNSPVKAADDPQPVVWNSPSKDARGSMPAGNGELGINAWVEPNGDLLLYLGRTDAWSENGRLLKLGRVRISFTPSLAGSGKDFHQELDYRDGLIKIHGGDTSVRVWVDAHHPLVQVDVDSDRQLTATVRMERWRTERRQLAEWEIFSAYGLHGDDGPPVYVEPDTIVPGQPGRIVWYHRNERSIWADNLKLQALGSWARTHDDPLLNRTFGGLIEGDGLESASPDKLATAEPRKRFSVRIHTRTDQSDTASQWMEKLIERAEAVAADNASKRLEAHRKWWHDFWDRSWIRITDGPDAETVSRAYVAQRWMNAGAGRGNYPIKFNGSIFNVPDTIRYGRHKGKKGNADFRMWGGPYWLQNTRFPYWSMLIAGDFDLMHPFFRMCREILPLRRKATREYFDHEGAFYWETMYFWGTATDTNYGRDREGKPDGLLDNQYTRRFWQGGLELSLIMLDYYAFTGDDEFAKKVMVPVGDAVLTFYDRHWERDEDGQIRFDPAQVLETYWKAVNPLPVIVGIRKVGEEMLRLPYNLTTEKQRRQWRNTLADLPPVPKLESKGHTILAPAEKYSDKHNAENAALYAVFPYRAYRVGMPDLQIAQDTFNLRRNRSIIGMMGQNVVIAACLGRINDAQSAVRKMAQPIYSHRYLGMWTSSGWYPHQDHGSNIMNALQRMLLQYDKGKIQLLPAWPENWDVEFKLHAPQNTVIEGEVKDGKLQNLEVHPESRREDIMP